MHPICRTPGLGAIGLLLALAAASPAQATDIAVSNFNFEANARPDGSAGTGQLSNWAIVGGANVGTYNPSTAFYNTPQITDPANSGVIGSMNGPNLAYIFEAGATITNTTGHAIVLGETYQLTVAVGQRSNAQSFSPVMLSLLDGNSLLASTTVSTPPAANSVGDVSLGYTAQAGDSGNLRIQLKLVSGLYGDFDNVRLTASAVPEPASLGLMALGLGGLAGMSGMRRQRSRAA